MTVLQVHEARFQIQLTMEQGPNLGANRSLRDAKHFTKPEGSLPCLQKPTTCPYSASDKRSPRPHPISLKCILILSPSTPGRF